MRKIIVGTMVSIDGVMQAHGRPTEDPTKGFTLGGWVMPYIDAVFGEETDRIFKNSALLLSRKTYEIFALYRPYRDGDSDTYTCFAGNGEKASSSRQVCRFRRAVAISRARSLASSHPRLAPATNPDAGLFATGWPMASENKIACTRRPRPSTTSKRYRLALRRVRNISILISRAL